MIFRDSNHLPIENKQDTERLLNSVKEFAQRLAPAEWQEKIDNIYQNLTVVTFDIDTKTHKQKVDGELLEAKMFNAAAHKFRDNIDMEEYTCTQGIAIHPDGSSQHVIVHEALHAFSDEIGRNDDGCFIKCGAHFRQKDKSGAKLIVDRGSDLTESITDALASRFREKLGPNGGASYADNVIVADLLMGKNIENNLFLQNVHWGDGKEFTTDFNNTINSANVKFEDYYDNFRVVSSDNASELLKGAIEYGLRKTETSANLEDVYSFQKEVLNLYKDGGVVTNFMDDENIEMIEDVAEFADKIKQEHKINLLKNRTNTSIAKAPYKSSQRLSEIDLTTLKFVQNNKENR